MCTRFLRGSLVLFSRRTRFDGISVAVVVWSVEIFVDPGIRLDDPLTWLRFAPRRILLRKPVDTRTKNVPYIHPVAERSASVRINDYLDGPTKSTLALPRPNRRLLVCCWDFERYMSATVSRSSSSIITIPVSRTGIRGSRVSNRSLTCMRQSDPQPNAAIRLLNPKQKNTPKPKHTDSWVLWPLLLRTALPA